MVDRQALGTQWLAHLRLCLLRLLGETPGYAANESLLTDAVHGLGIAASRDQVVGELAWLRDAQLITLEVLGGLSVAQVTQRGLDVSAGRQTYPGVKRPSPGA